MINHVMSLDIRCVPLRYVVPKDVVAARLDQMLLVEHLKRKVMLDFSSPHVFRPHVDLSLISFHVISCHLTSVAFIRRRQS